MITTGYAPEPPWLRHCLYMTFSFQFAAGILLTCYRKRALYFYTLISTINIANIGAFCCSVQEGRIFSAIVTIALPVICHNRVMSIQCHNDKVIYLRSPATSPHRKRSPCNDDYTLTPVLTAVFMPGPGPPSV